MWGVTPTVPPPIANIMIYHETRSQSCKVVLHIQFSQFIRLHISYRFHPIMREFASVMAATRTSPAGPSVASGKVHKT